MPELPEVETIIRGLSKVIKGRIIKKVIIHEKKLIAYPTSDEFKNKLIGQKITAVRRRGKYILIVTDMDMELIIHLRMTGRLLIKSSDIEYDKHSHVIFKLDGDLDLRFFNIRKFGRVYLVEKGDYQHAGTLNNLGPEPLAEDFTLNKFKKLFKKRSKNIKALLLDQTFLAGLGNIYTDEALYRAGISPERRADSLTETEHEKLFNAVQKVLHSGVKYGGTSFSDYVNALGEKGDFQEKLKVYQREGKECLRCGSIIKKVKIAGRGTRYCPGCQN